MRPRRFKNTPSRANCQTRLTDTILHTLFFTDFLQNLIEKQNKTAKPKSESIDRCNQMQICNKWPDYKQINDTFSVSHEIFASNK